MPDYVSVGVMPARRAGRRSRMSLCPLCRAVMYYEPDHTGIRTCERVGCGLQQNVVTSECVLPVENIPRAVARKLRGELNSNSGAYITEIATLTEKQILELHKAVSLSPKLLGLP